MKTERLLTGYYGATILFVLIDFGLGVNIRAAFLEPWPGFRVAYYGFCFACLGAMIWRPAWSTLVGTVESLVTLVALILGVGVRVMVPSDAIFGENARILTYQEIINFVLSGYIAYFAWTHGLKSLKKR
jgi:hypothetical protein